MSKFMMWVAGVAVVALMHVGCVPNYSNGERLGVVQKVSHRGLIFKSYEAQAILAVPGTLVQPEPWKFSVAPSAAEKVSKAAESGKRVKLTYHQYLLSPPTIDTDYVVTDVSEE